MSITVHDPTQAGSTLARIVFVTGKGGVGKTTVAAGLAAHAGPSQGVLVEFGDGEAGKRALGGRSAMVEHLVVRAEDALARAAAPLFGSGLLARIVLGNFAVKRFLAAAPAIREVAMLETV